MAGLTLVKSPLFGILKGLTSKIQSKAKAWQYGQIYSVGLKSVSYKNILSVSTFTVSTDDSITDEQQVSNSSNRLLCMFYQSGERGFHYAGDGL